jgi:hypothetical protein
MKRRNFIATVLCVLGLLFVIGFIFDFRLQLTDSSSGSVKELRFWGIIPIGTRIIHRSPAYRATNAVWHLGLSFSFQPLLNVGDVAIFRFGTNRAALRLKSSSSHTGRLVYEVYDSTAHSWMPCETRSSNERISPGLLPIGTNTVQWSPASDFQIYVNCDDYTTKPSNSLYGVFFPLSTDSAVDYVEHRINRTNLWQYPWESVAN